jgi:predicted permease
VSDFLFRLRALFKRTAVDVEIDDELRFHIDHQIESYKNAGLNEAEAARRARLEFGGLEQVKEDVRDAGGTPWFDDLRRDTLYALRTFRRLPGFAVIALLILALGIGATTVMFTVINSVLLKPLAYQEPDRLMTVHGFTGALGESWGVSYPDFVDARRQGRSMTMAAWRYGGGTVSAPGDPEYLNGREISSELFDVLGVPLSHGRSFLPDEDRPGALPVAIISHSLWQNRFGASTAAIGQQLVFEGTPYTVIGVAPAQFGLDGDVDVYTPLGQSTEPRMRNREARFLRVVARLVPGVAPSEAGAEITLIARRLAAQFPASNAGHGMLARPLQQDVVGDIGSTFWLLLIAVSLVLVVACVNVASLLLARAVSRERELATRVALGASRARVIRQCLTESGMLGLAGGVCGILLAAASVHPFISFWPGALPRATEIQLDWRVLLAAVTVSLATGLAFGAAPAMRVPTDRLEGTLRGTSGTVVRSSRRLHGAFVATELALAVVLLVSAGMLARTLLTLGALDPGLNIRNVLTARFALSPGVLGDPAQIRSAWRDVLDRARRVPGVESAALTDIVPMRQGENTVPYSVTAAPPTGENPMALASTVTPDYLNVMGIPLRAGRFFDDHDRLDSEPVVVVDDNLALQAFGQRDVAGRQLWVPAMGPAPLRIVGVVGHVRHWGLAGDDRSRVRDQMYYPFAQVPPPLLRTFASFMSVAVRTHIAPLDVAEPLRRSLRGTSSDQAMYEVRTMEQLVSGSLARQRFLALLFAIFAGIALLLASVGVYGVVSYLTGQRAREFGVRMALGATAHDVRRMVLRQTLGLIAVGAAVGSVGAWVAGRVLMRLVDGMRAAELSTVASTMAILVLSVLVASYVPARRASRADAMMALRQE